MLLITGGNGQLGKKLITQILSLKRQETLAVSVRDLDKAQDFIHPNLSLRKADFNDVTALRKSMAGIKTLFLISSDAPVTIRLQQHQNAIDVAKESGVSHILYTSFIDVDKSSPFAFSHIHAKTEEYIKKSGLNYTFLRNNLYTELLTLVRLSDTNQFSLPAGTGKVAFITRHDIATFAAKALMQPELHRNKIYKLTGPRAYSYDEIAQLLSQRLNKPISYAPVTVENFISKLTQNGMPKPLVEAIAGMYLAISDEQFGYAKISQDYENMVGAPAQDAQQFLLEM